jgi:glc operon protein GlcG
VWYERFEVMGKITGGMKMSRKTMVRCLAAVLIALCAMAGAVAQMPNPYGMPISLENARKAAAPAMAEAAKNNWTMAVAIVDPGGNLVYYEKMDNTQLGSATVAIDKARSAALFKRPTKALQDALAAGGDGLRILRLQGAVPIEGGIPLLMDGKIVGAIGVSGGTSAQDGQCAKAGADTIK